MNPDARLVRNAPAVGRLRAGGDEIDLVSPFDEAAGHLIRADAAGFRRRPEILVNIDDFHTES